MKRSAAEPYVKRFQEPRVASLIVSVVLHTLAIVGILGSSWLWRASAFKPVSSYTVSLVGAPLSLKQPPSTPLPKRPSKPKLPPKPTVKSPQSTPVKPVAKAPEPKPSPKKPEPAPKAPEAPKAPKVQSTVKPVPAPKPPAPKKPVTAKPKPLKKSPTPKKPSPPVAKPEPERPRVATSSEARSAVEALRKRQAAQRLKEEQAEAAKQQAAERVGPSRDQASTEGSVGPDAGQVAGLRQIRLSVYQQQVRTEITSAWILPLPPAESRDLQATAFFRILRDGRVEKLDLIQPSGNPLFDNSLMRAIQRVSPLPALPADYPGEVLEVEMRFRARES